MLKWFLRISSMLATAGLVTIAAPVSGQSIADPCAFATADRERASEYQLITQQLLGTSEEYRDAYLALSKAELALSLRITANLVAARKDAEFARTKLLFTPELAPIARSLGTECIARMQHYPKAEVAAVQAQAQRLQALATLPDARFEEAYKRETDSIRKAFATMDTAKTFLTTMAGQVRKDNRASNK